MLMFVDRESGKGLGITLFETEDAMRRGDEALNAMGPGAASGGRRSSSTRFRFRPWSDSVRPDRFGIVHRTCVAMPPSSPMSSRGRAVQSPVVTPEQRIAALEAHLAELSQMIANARRRPGLELSDDEKRRLDEQAKRVGDAARYFLMGP